MLASCANRLRIAILWSCPFLLAHCLEPSPAEPEGEPEGMDDPALPADTATPSLPDDSVATPLEDTSGFPVPTGGGEAVLTGRVIDRQGRPLAGAVAELARLGHLDTTDAEGGFEFRISAGEHPPQAKPGAALDTVRIREEDRTLALVGVPGYRDTLPDVRVIRLLLTGRLSSPLPDGSRLALTLQAGSGEPHDLPAGLDGTGLTWQASFLMGAGDSGLDCRALVRALDADGRLLGRSDTASFRADAGGSDLAAWDPGNALPSARAEGPVSARAGDSFRLAGEASDGAGGSIVRVEWDAGNRGEFSPADADGGISVSAPAQPSDGWECVLKAVDDEGHEALDTVAVRIEPDPFGDFRTFWGDVHTHSSFSLDHRPPDSATASACDADPACAGSTGADVLFRNAREASLDFAMITDHAEDLTPAEWEATLNAVAGHDEPGSFVPFAGYEYCDSVAGEEVCANVIFPGREGGPVFADRTFRRLEGGAATVVESMAGLHERLASQSPDAFVFLPHPSEDYDWSPVDDLGSGLVIGVEISSTGGGPDLHEARACRIPVLEAFRRGLRLQVLGAGNDHHGGPGRASLTGVLAPDLTREALVDALRRRRTFATRGSRLVLTFDAEGHPMGEAVVLGQSGDGDREVRLHASAKSPGDALQLIRIFRMLEGRVTELEALSGDGHSLTLEAVDSLPAGTSSLYWAEASLQGQNPDSGSEAWTTPVWVEVESAAQMGAALPEP